MAFHDYADGIRKMTKIVLVGDGDDNPTTTKAEFNRWFRQFQKAYPVAAEGYTRGGLKTMAWSDYPMNGHVLPVDRCGVPDDNFQLVLCKGVLWCDTFSDGEVIDPVNDPRVMKSIREHPDKMPPSRNLRDYAFALAAIVMRTPPDLEGLGPYAVLEPNGITIRIDGQTRALLWSDLSRVGWDLGRDAE